MITIRDYLRFCSVFTSILQPRRRCFYLHTTTKSNHIKIYYRKILHETDLVGFFVVPLFSLCFFPAFFIYLFFIWSNVLKSIMLCCHSFDMNIAQHKKTSIIMIGMIGTCYIERISSPNKKILLSVNLCGKYDLYKV